MATVRKIEDYDRVLVVEGYSDLLFYAEMLETLGLHERVFIQQFNGKQYLTKKIEAFITPQLLQDKQVIGVIVDADTNPEGAFTSIQGVLTKLTKQTVPAAGEWTTGTPRIGLFIAPAADAQGEIETLVWQDWSKHPSNAPARKCIEHFVACMAASGLHSQSPEKGLLSALLAIRNDDDPRLGPGARSKVFDLQSEGYADLKTFLSEFADQAG